MKEVWILQGYKMPLRVFQYWIDAHEVHQTESGYDKPQLYPVESILKPVTQAMIAQKDVFKAISQEMIEEGIQALDINPFEVDAVYYTKSEEYGVIYGVLMKDGHYSCTVERDGVYTKDFEEFKTFMRENA